MALISVTEYANRIGKNPCNIRRMLLSGRLEGRKIGKQWVLDENAVYPIDKRIVTGDYKNWRKYVEFNATGILAKKIKALSKEIAKSLNDCVNEIILYGSYARGTQTEESDIDIALKLNKTFTDGQYKELIEIVAKKEIECGIIISVVDIESKLFEKWKDVLPFYKNIQREGIVLWKRT